MSEPTNYKVFITPLSDNNTYGSEIDVSDYVDLRDISNIKSGVDNDDYDVGVFKYDFITLKAVNLNGILNDSSDFRSIFKFKRDLAKVKVKYFNDTSTISFNGLINEESTRQDIRSGDIRFKVLSLDSVIRNINVSSGQITNSMTYSDAIKSILNQPKITSVLTYNASDVAVDIDLLIDNPIWFDNRNAKEALDALFVTSNSVMTINHNTTEITVRVRGDNLGTGAKFFGPGDLQGRENIADIRNYNTGFHRVFNSIDFNGTYVEDEGLITDYGARLKKVEYGFVTDASKELQIANKILSQFKSPKIELEILVTTEQAKGLEFFDLVTIDYPFRVTPSKDHPIPIYGIAKYGDAVYPEITGSIKINPSIAFNVIGIKEHPGQFMSLIKLRQRGTGLSDGSLTDAGAFYGSAIYGESRYTENPDHVEGNAYNYGGATYGKSQYGS